MIFWGLFVLFVLPIVGIISFIGCVLGAISLYRTVSRKGKISFVSNLLVFLSCSLSLWAFHSGLVQRIQRRQSKLDYYIEKNNIKAVRRLLKKGANADSPNKNGLTPLHIAVILQNRELLETLIENNANVNALSTCHGHEGQTALHILAKPSGSSNHDNWDDIAIAKFLLQHGANPNIRAVDGVWPERTDVTPLTLAYEVGNKELANLLLSHGAEVNVSGGNSEMSLFHLAIKKCDTEMINTLIARHADITVKQENNQTPFDYAIDYASKEIFELLIVNYPEMVNAVNEKRGGEMPLCVAASRGRVEIVELLISNGADVTAKINAGATALHWTKKKEIAELLLSKGSDVNAKTDTGITPLHIAAGGTNEELVKFLIAHGADVNARDINGKTPLHRVTISWSKEVAEILVAHGADIYAKDKQGRTFVSMAKGSRKRTGDAGSRLQETLIFLEELERAGGKK